MFLPLCTIEVQKYRLINFNFNHRDVLTSSPAVPLVLMGARWVFFSTSRPHA